MPTRIRAGRGWEGTPALAPPGDLRTELKGRPVLYWWPDDGLQRGTVARLCPRGAFSHARQSSALCGKTDRCSMPPPTAPAGCFSRQPPRRVWPGPFGPGPPDPKFEFGRWLVTAPGQELGGQRTFAENVLLMPTSAAFSVVTEDSSAGPFTALPAADERLSGAANPGAAAARAPPRQFTPEPRESMLQPREPRLDPRVAVSPRASRRARRSKVRSWTSGCA